MKKLAVVGLFTIGCSIPNLSGLHLSDCTKQCNKDSQVCFDAANLAAETCLSNAGANQTEVVNCAEIQIKATEACESTTSDCMSICFKQAEDQLK
jgi:hypothetical protein